MKFLTAVSLPKRLTILIQSHLFHLLLVLSLIFGSVSAAFAQTPRAMPEGERPDDVRLQPLKDLNGYFPFQPPESKEAWEARAEEVRTQLKVALGLWPLPPKTPLNAVIHGKIEKEDYTVERVYFESMPGFFVCGSLYRPKNVSGKSPGVLCPHGHWANGRFYDAGEATAKNEVKSGAEPNEETGRSPLQARCVHLARMGCVVFHYDMQGNADTQQLSQALAHGFAKQRPHMNAADGWGLFSPRAESYLQSVMGLQTWNSIRALDFLESLPDVDSERLAVTGASGGGTQTFVLCAIDPRPAVSFPAVMVSTAMQGGCTCENCSLLRVGTGNVEFAALFAPKPQAMSAADDWTKEMSTKGFPELKELYTTVGAPENVALISRTEFGHNYNAVSRAFMYEWFNKHLHLNADTEEKPFDRLSNEEMTVWNDEHPQPQGGEEFEKQLLQAWKSKSSAIFDADRAVSKDDLAMFRKVSGPAFDVILQERPLDAKQLNWELVSKTDEGNYLNMTGLLESPQYQESLPVTFLHPKEWNGRVVLILHEAGKAGLYTDAGEVAPHVRELLERKFTVAGIDLLMQGEFLENDEKFTTTRRVNNTREAAGYTFGYNPTLLVRRSHDVITMLNLIRNRFDADERPETEQVIVVAEGSTAPIAIAARTIASDLADAWAFELKGFRFEEVDQLHSPSFLPGSAKYGDVPGMLMYPEPQPVYLDSESESAHKLLASAFEAQGKRQLLADPDESLLSWIQAIGESK